MRRLSLSKIIVLTLALLTIIHSDHPQQTPESANSKKSSQILLPKNVIATSASSMISNTTISPSLSNYNGPNVTPEQIASFKNYINLASTFYRDDVRARLNYISNKMNQTYGVNGDGFTVVVYHFTAYWLWTTYSYNGVWASIERGFDPVFPQASYMFLREPINSGRSHFLQNSQKGSGITSDLELVITNIIARVQQNIIGCGCYGLTEQISGFLRQYDGGYWNVYCSSSPNFEVLAYTRSNKYLFTHPRYCYFALYDIRV